MRASNELKFNLRELAMVYRIGLLKKIILFTLATFFEIFSDSLQQGQRKVVTTIATMVTRSSAVDTIIVIPKLEKMSYDSASASVLSACCSSQSFDSDSNYIFFAKLQVKESPSKNSKRVIRLSSKKTILVSSD